MAAEGDYSYMNVRRAAKVLPEPERLANHPAQRGRASGESKDGTALT